MSIGSNANIVSRRTGIPFAEVRNLLNKSDSNPTALTPSERETVDKFLTLSKLDRELSGSIDIGSWVRINMPPPPALPAAMRDAEIKNNLIAIKAKILSTITDWRDPGKSLTYTNLLNFSIPPYDREVVSLFQMEKLHKQDYLNKYKSEIQSGLQFAQTQMASGGTMQGLFTRLGKGISGPTVEMPKFFNAQFNRNWKSQIEAYLPFASPYNLFGAVPDSKWAPNLAAAYGLPYPDKLKGSSEIKQMNEPHIGTVHLPVVRSGIEMMNHDYNLIMSKLNLSPQMFSLWAQSNEGMTYTTVLIKNKTEVMDRSEFLTKVRPYYVIPAGIGAIYSTLFEWYHEGRKNFVQDPSSVSMIGFSWCHGGGDVIVSIIANLKPGEARNLIYADDATLIVRCLDGMLLIFYYDMKYMDMRLATWHGQKFSEYMTWKGGNSIDQQWKKVIVLWGRGAITAPRMFPGGNVAQLPRGLISGIAGTSDADEFASVAVWADSQNQPRPLFQNCANIKEARAHMSQFSIIANSHNLVIKEGTDECEIIDLDSGRIVGPIMGFSLEFVRGHWLPTPNPDKLVASLIYPTNSISDPNEKAAYRCIRSLGLCVSGGYRFPFFYTMCKYLWTEAIEKHMSPDFRSILNKIVIQGLPENSEGDQFKLNLTQMLFRDDGSPNVFPPVEYFEDLYSSVFDSQEPEKFVKPVVLPQAVFEDTFSWADAEEAEEKEINAHFEKLRNTTATASIVSSLDPNATEWEKSAKAVIKPRTTEILDPKYRVPDPKSNKVQPNPETRKAKAERMHRNFQAYEAKVSQKIKDFKARIRYETVTKNRNRRSDSQHYSDIIDEDDIEDYAETAADIAAEKEFSILEAEEIRRQLQNLYDSTDLEDQDDYFYTNVESLQERLEELYGDYNNESAYNVEASNSGHF